MTARVKNMITWPLPSMSVGAPNAARSTGSTSVSNVTPIDWYSASLKPPAGLLVSATTIALSRDRRDAADARLRIVAKVVGVRVQRDEDRRPREAPTSRSRAPRRGSRASRRARRAGRAASPRARSRRRFSNVWSMGSSARALALPRALAALNTSGDGSDSGATPCPRTSTDRRRARARRSCSTG